eukprot:s9650_g2.t1
MWRPCSPTSLAAETVGLLKDHPLLKQLASDMQDGSKRHRGWQFNLELWAALWNFFADSDLDRSVASVLARLEVASGQPFALEILQALVELSEDPDKNFVEHLAGPFRKWTKSATIIGVNDNIRANTDKKTTAPTLYDKLHLLEKNLTLFKSDVSRAHRRIKVLKKHWKYMVAKIKDKFWVNKVGTYGVASAQLYWGRLAAILMRLSYHISEIFLWVLTSWLLCQTSKVTLERPL